MKAFRFEVYRDGVLQKEIALPTGEHTIGRGPESAVSLPDPRISRTHARLLVDSARVKVLDEGSVHGIEVNGRRVREAELSVGESVTIGPFMLRLAEGSAAPSAAAPGVAAAGGRLDAYRERLRGLGEVASLVGVTDLRAVLGTLLEYTMALIEARRGFVMLATRAGLSPVVASQGEVMDREPFSRTVCQKALDQKRTVLLTGPEDLSPIRQIESLAAEPPGTVLAVPLVDGAESLGVLYLESDVFLPQALGDQLRFADEISTIGGRALRAALDREQITSARERWRCLASLHDEPADLAKTCQSTAMRAVLSLVERIGPSDATVLILGENGTGKEVVARALHARSPRHSGPFVAVNCGAIPRDLMEAELFGHEKGAFTGAVARRPGRFELATGGTLLLDELGDLPRDLQVKLLRVLETRTFERVGGTAAVALDARILGATNRNLDELIARGEFREDLYYRLNVVTIRLPALRERPEDIEPLSQAMLVNLNRRSARKLYGITPEALTVLRGYPWPGNVRELRNVIERALLLEATDRLTPSSLPFGAALPASVRGEPVLGMPEVPDEPPALLADAVRRFEARFITAAMDHEGGNVTRTARRLGLTRSALQKKMRNLGMRSRDSKP